MSTHQHGFNAHPTVPNYEVCSECASMHRIADLAPASVYSDSYWNRPGCSTLKEQVYNVSQFKNEAGESKIDSVLKYAKGGDRALEIACAPGALLNKLHETYKHVVGIEYDPRYRQEMLDITQGSAALVFGAFPEVTAKWPEKDWDFICGMDILEHVNDYEAFILECKRLLKADGTLVLMAPLLMEDGLIDEKNFCPEHIWLHSEKNLKEALGEHFKTVKFDRWIVGHDLIVAEGVKR